MGGVPSKPGDPSRPVEVIGAGFSRTGTMSMQLALEEILRVPVSKISQYILRMIRPPWNDKKHTVHGATHILFREDAFGKKLTQVYEAREAGEKTRTLSLLRELVAKFAGVTDLPAINFVPELLELYPDAKVVLVTRERNRWWENFGKVLSVLAASMPGLRWFPGTVVHRHKGISRLMEEEKAGTPVGPKLMELHNAKSSRSCPPN